VSNLVNLVKLDISENRLEELPAELQSCSQLEELDCSDNSLASFPAVSLLKLRVLDAYKNSIKTLPDSLGDCTSLETLNVFNNKLIKLPASLSKLTELREVIVASNKLKTLPKVENWKKLTRLGAFWNTLVMLPSFAGLESLEVLQLYDNQLENFPEMGSHPALSEINCNNNRIEVLESDAFAGLPALESLQLANNRLKTLPGTIFNPDSFTFLNVSENPLECIPEEIGNSSHLQVLFWASTNTVSLPESMLTLEELSRVDFQENQFDAEALEMCKKLEAIVEQSDGFFKR